MVLLWLKPYDSESESVCRQRVIIMVTQKRIFTFLWFKVQLEIVLFVSFVILCYLWIDYYHRPVIALNYRGYLVF